MDSRFPTPIALKGFAAYGLNLALTNLTAGLTAGEFLNIESQKDE
jgi:hypothetical protein